jgi:pimeloyl-ACP methyl ester carboxylesterase
MDEASSKFVDQLALERLLEEKLTQTHHQPSRIDSSLFESAFPRMKRALQVPKSAPVSIIDAAITIESPEVSGYPENNTVPIYIHPAVNERGASLLVHGLYEDNRSIYGFLVRELNRLGVTVYMITLPFHHERSPVSSGFSGELFFSADLGRTKAAFVQAVIEIRHCYNLIRRMVNGPLVITGFSMGGTLALAATASDDTIEGTIVVNPAAVLAEVVWTSPLLATIKNDLLSGGWHRATIDRTRDRF